LGKLYFTCSFDDGDVADLRLANLLTKYNIKGTFYIPKSCNLVSKSLIDRQIKHLSEAFEIGGHTMTHEILTQISNEAARSEIYNSKSWLEDVTGKLISSFCPPTGRFHDEHILFQKKAGYTTMRTVEMLSFSLPKIKKQNEFVVLPTTTQVYNHTSTAYLKNVIKRWNVSNVGLLKKLFDSSWDEMSRKSLIYLIEASEASQNFYFHLWGHSWEIEKYALWNSLEFFLRELAASKEIVFCTNAELADIVRCS
jgi:hypothetical protein